MALYLDGFGMRNIIVEHYTCPRDEHFGNVIKIFVHDNAVFLIEESKLACNDQ